MAGANNLTANNCSAADLVTFKKSMTRLLWRHNALLVTEAILAGVIVGIAAFGQHYRHHPLTRFIFLGATTLFLPIISSLVSTVGFGSNYVFPFQTKPLDQNLSSLVAICTGTINSIVHVTWAFLVQIIMVNTSTIVPVDDREGQSKGPPFQLLIQGVWTFYLGAIFFKRERFIIIASLLSVTPFVLLSAKLALKYYASQKARWSFALGRNPGLIVVYMQQLRAHEANLNVEQPVGEDAPPPALLVMGEEEKQVEIQSGGYAFKDDSATMLTNNNIGLVTLERVWQLDSMLPISTPRLKDLCLSFALFKLLRCRFSRYNITNAGSMGTLTFFRSLLLNACDHDRVFGVIADELSFVYDYYYSSLPISYSKSCLPILSIILSFLCIGFCLLPAEVVISGLVYSVNSHKERGIIGLSPQVICTVWCIKQPLVSNPSHRHFGRLYYDWVPVLLLVVLTMIAEVRDMASYICSNWTKVTLICRYVNRASSQQSHSMPKWVRLLLRCRCQLMRHWNEEMGQCSVLMLHSKMSPLVLVRRLLHLPDHKRKAKVPAAVKVCVLHALSNSFDGGLSNGAASLHRNQVGESFLWACNGKGTSDTILVWHIATCILEVKHPYRCYEEQGSPTISNSDHKTAATHLSRYCAYLVTWCPELLPDNVAWSKDLYKAVKKDAERVLNGHPATGSSMPEDEYRQLVEVLSAKSKDEVLKNGVKLGKQLGETINDEETAWKLLADFWSEMILYVAPSNNLKGHSEAIARGGELITLLWAMLFHAGIISRPGEDDSATATSDGTV